MKTVFFYVEKENLAILINFHKICLSQICPHKSEAQKRKEEEKRDDNERRG